MTIEILAAVEGDADEAVAVRLIEHVGAVPGPIHGKRGKAHLRQKRNGYNHAAHRGPWLLLVDLDRNAGCAPQLRAAWLPRPAPLMCFRIAVRAVEAWLLADAEAVADFLGVARTKVPRNPEALSDPKAVLVDLARRSRCGAIREDMARAHGGGWTVGRAYTSRVRELVERHWRPAVAAKHADSLARAIRCLKTLVERVA
ncbi:MAG: hypothetical protein NZ898_01575 [Myxococcota bacterium]|nr:hypothetical protein [Myxococcota bacterium]MDW8362748.1 hypothetical protein [Myxococcales bacterium]